MTHAEQTAPSSVCIEETTVKYAPVLSASGVAQAGAQVQPDTGVEVVTDTDVDTRTQPPWHVILYNDDVHSFEDVILWVQKSCGCSLEEAMHITFEAHFNGRSVCYHGAKAECEKVCGALRGYGLQAEIDTLGDER